MNPSKSSTSYRYPRDGAGEVNTYDIDQLSVVVASCQAGLPIYSTEIEVILD